jgi:general stress protein CsbA
MIIRTAVTARVGIGAILAAVALFCSTYQRYENAFWIAFVLALMGFGLLILSFIDSIRGPEDNDNISLFENGSERALPKRRNTSPVFWPTFLSTIGLLYSQILLLLVIPGVLIFDYAWGHGLPHYGVYVLSDLSPTMKKLSCGTNWVVRIDERENWYLNSTKTTARELPWLLGQQLGQSTNCAVYLDVDPSLMYAVAVQAIDLIQATQSKAVVLVTPEMKKLSLH